MDGIEKICQKHWFWNLQLNLEGIHGIFIRNKYDLKQCQVCGMSFAADSNSVIDRKAEVELLSYLWRGVISVKLWYCRGTAVAVWCAVGLAIGLMAHLYFQYISRQIYEECADISSAD